MGGKAQWLLEAVEFECLTYWLQRGRRSPALRQSAPPPGLDHLEDAHGRVVAQLRWLLRARAA